MIYFHRNAEDIGICRQFCQCIRDQLYVHVLVVEYPGYGPGPCGEQRRCVDLATRHAFATVEFVKNVLNWPADSIIIGGASIGSCFALKVGASQRFGGLFLVSPMQSLRDLCQFHLGQALGSTVTEYFPNEELAKYVWTPTLVIHGTADRVIPNSHAVTLFRKMKCRKALVCPPGLDHNSCLLRDAKSFLRPLVEFFSLPDYSFEEISVPLWAFVPPGTKLPGQEYEKLLDVKVGPFQYYLQAGLEPRITSPVDAYMAAFMDNQDDPAVAREGSYSRVPTTARSVPTERFDSRPSKSNTGDDAEVADEAEQDFAECEDKDETRPRMQSSRKMNHIFSSTPRDLDNRFAEAMHKKLMESGDVDGSKASQHALYAHI